MKTILVLAGLMALASLFCLILFWVWRHNTTTEWIVTYPDNPLMMRWPTEPGLYWVIYMGDSEPGECGTMLYDFPDYLGMFQITDYDEEDGTPIGHDRQGDNSWEQVVAYFPIPIMEPSPYPSQ